MKIKVLDDDLEYLNKTCSILKEYCRIHPRWDIQLQSFSDAGLLMDSVNSNDNYTIYFLDIMLPCCNGIDLGKEIRRIEKSAVIIYITYSPDFAVDSYGVEAFHYLLKPVDKFKLLEILDLAIQRIEIDSKRILLIKTKEGIRKMSFHNIQYLEYKNHKIQCCLEDGIGFESVTMREPFRSIIAPLLLDECFAQPHVSYVVNMKFIDKLEARKLIMQNQMVIPVSRSLYGEFKKQYMEFWIARKSILFL